MINKIIFIVLSLSLSVSIIAQDLEVKSADPAIEPSTENVAVNIPPVETIEKTPPQITQKENLDNEDQFKSRFVAKQTVSDRNKFELYAGYSGAALYSNVFEPIENGFNVSAVYYFHKYIGVKVDASGTYKNFRFGLNSGDHSLYNLTAGVQFKDSSKDTVWKPFAHVMVGVADHKDTYQNPVGNPFNFDFTGFSTIAGGGLDIKVHRRIDIRAIQADLNVISYSQPVGPSSNYNNIRFGAGIVFNF